ncbi:uncharacterized [Tachysurus ichikawai]
MSSARARSCTTVASLSKQAGKKKRFSTTGRARTAKHRQTKLSPAAVASPFISHSHSCTLTRAQTLPRAPESPRHHFTVPSLLLTSKPNTKSSFPIIVSEGYRADRRPLSVARSELDVRAATGREKKHSSSIRPLLCCLACVRY